MFEILDSFNPKWTELAKKYELGVNFTPQYCRVWEENGDGKAKLFFYESNHGVVLYPFLIRRINDLKFLKRDGPSGDLHDITTPYGYGGPLIESPNRNTRGLLVNEFIEEFSLFCRKNNIISEFIRFNPLLENQVDFIGKLDTEKANSVIYVNLTLSEEEIWRNYKRNNQKNIKKALRNGVEIIVNKKLEFLNEFVKIYYETMRRKNATHYYFFSNDFFNSIRLLLISNSVLFLSKVNGKVVSVELALYDDNVIYSFLGGTLPGYFPVRPNNLLKHELILWAKKRGIKYYLIGGGYNPDDGIFEYKHSFSKEGVKDFFIGKKIHDVEKYKILESKFRSYLSNHNISVNLDKINYFPIYRYIVE